MFNFDADFDRQNKGSFKWDAHPSDVIPMFIADMDFPSPPNVTDALRKRLEYPVFPYEHGADQLISSAVGWFKRVYGLDVPAEWLLPAVGIVPALRALIRISSKPAITNSPNYSLLFTTPERFDGTMLKSPLTETRSEDGLLSYAVDYADLERQSKNAELFYFTNPHNPIGKVYERSELEELARIAQKNDLIVLSDEIHCEILFGKRHTPFFDVLKENSVTLFAAGKVCNLPGLPHSFVVVPDEQLRERVKRVTGGLGNPGTLSYIAAAAAFSAETDEWKRELSEYLAANRDYLRAELLRRLPKLFIARTDATYLQWIDFGAYVDGNAKAFVREYAKLELTDSVRFGATGNYARMNFACPRFRLTEALDRLEAAVNSSGT
jgi:cystathionine beta-lyase